MSEKKAAVKFTKEQFLKSANFTPVQKDVLSSLLKDDEAYTLDQVQKLIEDFAKRTVN
ncbi:hypothetical protein [Thermicanus aegyptius]|uniref:hypothetical protein n=1 Tax=Thermicanus aegyptius TaxID=94009 RepID=UPI0003F51F68|nr:hypothetical protein [Thermicanus aegyptius]